MTSLGPVIFLLGSETLESITSRWLGLLSVSGKENGSCIVFSMHGIDQLAQVEESDTALCTTFRAEARLWRTTDRHRLAELTAAILIAHRQLLSASKACEACTQLMCNIAIEHVSHVCLYACRLARNEGHTYCCRCCCTLRCPGGSTATVRGSRCEHIPFPLSSIPHDLLQQHASLHTHFCHGGCYQC